jgi:hypothetical protein
VPSSVTESPCDEADSQVYGLPVIDRGEPCIDADGATDPLALDAPATEHAGKPKDAIDLAGAYLVS